MEPQSPLHLCETCEEFVQAFTDGVGRLTPEGEKALHDMGWRPGTLSEEELQILQEMTGEKLSFGSEESDPS